MLKTGKIDFLVTDWNMPGMDGLTLLKEVRSDDNLKEMPVLMVTAEAKRETDPETRKTMYLDLQKAVQTDSPFIIMFQSTKQTALRSNVEGFVSGASFDLVFYRGVTK